MAGIASGTGCRFRRGKLLTDFSHSTDRLADRIRPRAVKGGHFGMEVRAVVGKVFGDAHQLPCYDPSDAADEAAGDDHYDNDPRYAANPEAVKIDDRRGEQEIQGDRERDWNQDRASEIKDGNHRRHHQDGLAGKQTVPGALDFHGIVLYLIATRTVQA